MKMDDTKSMCDFLRALDAADFNVSDWEAEFIESNLTQTHFSPKQREIVLKLAERYAKRLGLS